MVLPLIAFQFGEPVVSRRELDPRNDRLGLYFWGTIVWHLFFLVGAILLIVGGRALLNF